MRSARKMCIFPDNLQSVRSGTKTKRSLATSYAACKCIVLTTRLGGSAPDKSLRKRTRVTAGLWADVTLSTRTVHRHARGGRGGSKGSLTDNVSY